MNEACKVLNLSINVEKSKVMVCEKINSNPDCAIVLGDKKLELVSQFVYLGSLLQNDGRIDGEIDRRVNAGLRVVGATSSLSRNLEVDQKCKLAVYESVVVPTLMYASETWVWKGNHRSKVVATEMKYLRSMCGKTRMDRIRNEDIKNTCGVRKDVSEKVCENMLRWFGHVERMDESRLTKVISTGRVNGVRSRGRPRKCWEDQILECLKEKKVLSRNVRRACIKRPMDIREARTVCKERNEWRKIVFRKT